MDSKQPTTVENVGDKPGCASVNGSAQSFIIIYHHWWMDSGSFEEEIYEAKSREEAEQYAAAKCHRKSYTFQNYDYHVVKAVTRITTEPKPRALKWSERITGRIAPNRPS